MTSERNRPSPSGIGFTFHDIGPGPFEEMCQRQGITPEYPHDSLSDEPETRCTNPAGHEWHYTGTAYGGDDERWCGEGRVYCVHCGADGDA